MNLKIIPIIPSLNANEKTVKFINELIEIGFKKIIVVNDGSSKEYDCFYNELKNKNECIVLNHAVNQGKGRGLKTAYNYFLNYLNDYDGVVTADADGQHSANDTLNVAEAINKYRGSLILGTRNFNDGVIPLRSKFGNKCTSFIMKLLYGKKINDTQTGLRGIPSFLIPKCLGLSGEKYDYEINMLIEAIKENIELKEIEIETIYEDNNAESHFNPIKDSIRIYKIILGTFFKYTFSSLFSFAIDIVLFALLANHILTFLQVSPCIIVSTILSRMISSLVNFSINKNIFEDKKNTRLSIIRYYILCLSQMLLSALLTTYVYSLIPFSKVISKMSVDVVLFFINYRIQKQWVFRG